MAELTAREFSKHLNSQFRLKVKDQDLPLQLVEVKPYLPQENEQQGLERFSVFFEGPGDLLLPQQVYRLAHDRMGDFELFLVPVSGDQRGYRYEAVFNYFKD
jgi:hypothetical protein